MKTFMEKAQAFDKKWYIIDAADKPLGRVAAAAAVILRGKHKPTFTPNVDCGDFVIIINTDKVVLTGNKLDQKEWHRHSGYVGGLKSIKYRSLMASRSDKAMMLAVEGMLPHNSLGRAALRKLRVYKNDQHEHQAQKPIMWDREIK